MEIEKIYTMFFKDIFRYVFSLTKDVALAEDITQDTFLKSMKNIDTYDGDNIKAWLFTIAKNTLYTYYSRQKTHDTKMEMLANECRPSSDILTEMIRKEAAVKITEFVELLNEPYHQVFHLRHYGELSFDEIGMMYRKSSGWARTIYYRAKKQIAEKMKEEGYE